MSNLSEATAKIFEILNALDSQERLRVVRASLMLFGEELPASASGASVRHAGEQNSLGNEDISGIHAMAQQWMRKNRVSLEQLEHFFHFDQGRFIPIALPGNATSKREQTANAYLAQGLAAFLATGDASFSDADARKFCEQSGCYDSANHAVAVKTLANRVTGSKSSGFKLTAPGLSAIAELVKQPKS